MKKFFQIFALVAVAAIGLTLTGCDMVSGLLTKSESTTTVAIATTAPQGQTTVAPTTEGQQTTVAPTTVATTTIAPTTVVPTTTAHVHQYGDWTVVTPSSCNAEGLEERTCTCGAKETQAVAMDPHAMVSVEAKEATLEASGNIAYDQCQNCQKIFVDGKEATVEDVTIPQKQVLTVAKAVEIVNALDYSAGSATADGTYVVKGIVTKGAYSSKSSSYTLYIADSADSAVLLQVYSPKNDAPQYYIGQEITVEGQLMAYVKNDTMTPEAVKPTVIAQTTSNQSVVRGTEEAPLTVSEAVESIKLSILPDTEASVVKAIVKEVKSSSFVITDGTAELTVYTKPTAEVVVGEEIVVTGKYCAYYETMEMTNNTWVINHKMAAFKDNAGIVNGVIKSGTRCTVCGKIDGEESATYFETLDLKAHCTGYVSGDNTVYTCDEENNVVTVKKIPASISPWFRLNFNKSTTNYKYAYLIVKGSTGINVGAKVDTNTDPRGNAYDGVTGNKQYKGASDQVAVFIWDLEEIGIPSKALEKFVLWAYAAKDTEATSGTIEIIGAGLANISELGEAISAHYYSSTATPIEGGHEYACPCGAKKFEEHTLVDDARVEPTYEAAGKEAGKHCEKCSYTEGGAAIPMLEKVTVTFDTDGGTTIDPVKVIPGTKASALAQLSTTKEGYNFVGWYIGEIAVTPDMEVTQDVTVTAKWEAAHTHEYGYWTITKPATATEKGEETRYCTCGASETTETPAVALRNPLSTGLNYVNQEVGQVADFYGWNAQWVVREAKDANGVTWIGHPSTAAAADYHVGYFWAHDLSLNGAVDYLNNYVYSAYVKPFETTTDTEGKVQLYIGTATHKYAIVLATKAGYVQIWDDVAKGFVTYGWVSFANNQANSIQICHTVTSETKANLKVYVNFQRVIDCEIDIAKGDYGMDIFGNTDAYLGGISVQTSDIIEEQSAVTNLAYGKEEVGALVDFSGWNAQLVVKRTAATDGITWFGAAPAEERTYNQAWFNGIIHNGVDWAYLKNMSYYCHIMPRSTDTSATGTVQLYFGTAYKYDVVCNTKTGTIQIYDVTAGKFISDAFAAKFNVDQDNLVRINQTVNADGTAQLSVSLNGVEIVNMTVSNLALGDFGMDIFSDTDVWFGSPEIKTTERYA